MKWLIPLLLLISGVAWAAPCTRYSVGTTSTQIWPGWSAPLSYLLVQNVSPLTGCDVYCSLGTSNAVTVNGGTLLTPHGGAWMPPPPIPVGLDLSCIADGCTAQVQVCWW